MAWAVLFLLLPHVAEAQKENAHWVTGALRYNFSTAPTTIIPEVNDCNSATISNPLTGELELYGNGMCVFDAHRIPIMGTLRSLVSGSFVFAPGSLDTIFYLGENASWDGSDRLLIMRLVRTAGSWRVATKDSILRPFSASQGLGGLFIRHANNRDYWYVSLTSQWGQLNRGGLYVTYLVTKDGVDPTPVVSNAQIPFQIAGDDMKASQDGRRIAIMTSKAGLQLADFDRVTGEVSHIVQISDPSPEVEFSPNSRYLYASSESKSIFQYDLSLPDSEVMSKRTKVWAIGEAPFPASGSGDLSLGMDEKVYGVFYNGPNGNTSIGAIPHPDLPAPLCGLDSLINGWSYDIGHNYCNTSYEPPKPHYSHERIAPAGSACSPQCVNLLAESDTDADEYVWRMPGAEVDSVNGILAQACYDSAGTYPVFLYSRWGTGMQPVRDTMVQYVKIADRLLANFEPLRREYAVHAEESVSVPLQFELPSSIQFESFRHTGLRYHLAFDTAFVQLRGLTAPSNWKLDTNFRDGIMIVQIDTMGALMEVPQVINLGIATLALKPGVSFGALRLPNLTFTAPDSDRMICANTDANVVAYLYRTASIPASNRQSFSVSLLPNPVGEQLKVSVNVSETTVAWIDVFDVLGKRVNVIPLTNRALILNAGSNGFVVDFSELPTGPYYIRVQTDKGNIRSSRVLKR
jgi:hypothetical protein